MTVRLMVVLGTDHRLQGLKKARKRIDDPSYVKLLEQTIRGESIDFIFEEAKNLGPSIAETLASDGLGSAQSVLSSPCYLDVDPSETERLVSGIEKDTGSAPIPIDPGNSADCYQWEYSKVQNKREEFWLRKINGKSFVTGLFICGCNHLLSFSFRLQSAGIEVKSMYYVPFHKLDSKEKLS